MIKQVETKDYRVTLDTDARNMYVVTAEDRIAKNAIVKEVHDLGLALAVFESELNYFLLKGGH